MSLKLGNSLCKHQSVSKVTQWNLKVISLHVDLFHYTPPFLSGLSYDWKIAFTVVDYRKAVIFMKVILLSKYTQIHTSIINHFKNHYIIYQYLTC